MKLLPAPYRSVFKIFGKYWKLYGRGGAFFTSPYLHVSLVLSLLMHSFVFTEKWVELSLAVIPSVLGFSLGGYAILLAFANERFLAIISRGKGSSPLLRLSSAFVHFIVVQILAVTVALLYSSSPVESLPLDVKLFIIEQVPYAKNIYTYLKLAFSSLGLVLLVYALATALAATMAIFRVSTWYSHYLSGLKNDKCKCDKVRGEDKDQSSQGR